MAAGLRVLRSQVTRYVGDKLGTAVIQAYTSATSVVQQIAEAQRRVEAAKESIRNWVAHSPRLVLVQARVLSRFPQSSVIDWISYVQQAQRDIQGALKRNRLEPMHSEANPVVDAANYSLPGGNPAWSTLCFAAADTFGVPRRSVMPLAVALEYLLAAGEIMDDRLDGAEVRRGRKATHLAYSERLGDLATIMMASRWHVFVDDLPCTTSALREITGIFHYIVQSQCEGEGSQLNLDAHMETLNQNDRIKYLEHIAFQKIGVIAEGTLTCVGIIAGRPRQEIESLRLFGRELGIILQMIDDVQDIQQDHQGPDPKLTFVSVLGRPEQVRAHIDGLRDHAIQVLENVSGDTAMLVGYLDFAIHYFLDGTPSAAA